jgi:spermidine synthase
VSIAKSLHSPSAVIAAWSAATILLGSFLLFQVQPVIGKVILPWFGGSPGVWTTCMLFFQALLLLGYGYAHGLVRWLRPSSQAIVHSAMLVAALLMLPILPDASWKPTGEEQPTWRILALLATHVGVPYVLLSSTGPLVQAWYARAYPQRSPYRLYALSNAGSLGALLSFPFLFEPMLSSRAQATLWSSGLVAFVSFSILLAILASRVRPHATPSDRPEATASDADAASSDDDASGISAARRLTWLLLAALGSTMLLAVTSHISQDVAVIPFLWIAPLSLYLLTFILCFEHEGWYVRRWYALALGVMVVEITFLEVTHTLLMEVLAYLAVLMLICMVCHGEIARTKPGSRHLTSYYFMIAAGGALGGALNAMVFPRVFSDYWELDLGLFLGLLLAMVVVADDCREAWLRPGTWRRTGAAVCAISVAMIVAWARFEPQEEEWLLKSRNFYGILGVTDEGDADSRDHRRSLFHGRILHGMQFLDENREREPTLYYREYTGLGIAMRRLSRPLRVGVVGLGVGTVAAYGQEGDYLRFYEINPAVIELSSRYFTFLEQSPARIDLILGDARLSMEREEPQRFDILVLDAFSGDAIPLHLLTREAFQLYLRHLRPDGLIAVHVSNLHLNLTPVVAGIAKLIDLRALQVNYGVRDDIAGAASTWLLLTSNQEFLADPLVQKSSSDVEGTYDPVPVWTDQYSSLLHSLE